MGADIKRSDAELNTESGRSVEAAAGTGTGTDRGKREPNTDTGAGATGTGTGTRTGTRAGTGEKGKQADKSNEILPVVPAPEKPKKKTRRKKVQKKDEPSLTSDQITALIVATSGIFGSREGMEMFVLSEMEAQQIAVPLTNIIQKSDKLSQISEHADTISLVTACLVVMMPRIILYSQQNKEKKKKKEALKLVRTTDQSERNNRAANRENTANTKTVDHGISSAIPPII